MHIHIIHIIGVVIIMLKLYKRSYQARRWIKFGVLPSFLPIASVVIYDIYLGYTINNIINRHLLDFLLIVFAITVSVFSSAMILYKNNKQNNEKSENSIGFSMLIGFFCSGFFALLYDQIDKDDPLSFRKVMFCLLQVAITFFIIYKGMKTEEELENITEKKVYTNYDMQPQEEKQNNV